MLVVCKINPTAAAAQSVVSAGGAPATAAAARVLPHDSHDFSLEETKEQEQVKYVGYKC